MTDRPTGKSDPEQLGSSELSKELSENAPGNNRKVDKGTVGGAESSTDGKAVENTYGTDEPSGGE